ncbi:MAG: VOC family protein [bacterium]|nr:VOC family protein [bacterium]
MSAAAADEPTASIRYLVIDCLDLDRSSAFWGSLLGLAPGRRLDNYLFMGPVLPGCELVLQQVDRVTADKSPVHFDIEGSNEEDFDMILSRSVRLGGRIVETVEEAEYTLTVMADPDGNEFCVNRIPFQSTVSGT